MKSHFKFPFSIFLISALMMGKANALAAEPTSFAEMPKSCQQIAPEQLTFELPISIQKLTSEQQKKIQAIIEEARTQACILQIQYNGLLQQVIAMLFERNDITNEQLKPFYDQLTSLSQNKIENNFKTILSIRKLLSEKEWQDLTVAYTRNATVKSEFIKQQIELQQSYDVLISGSNPSEFTTLPLMAQSFCIETNPKIQMIEQIISTLSLTNTQQGHVRNNIRLQEKQFCTVKQDMTHLIGQFLQLLTQQFDETQTKQYQDIFNQIVTKSYLQETNRIQALLSLFQILTLEQKTQLREKYMMMKGVL